MRILIVLIIATTTQISILGQDTYRKENIEQLRQTFAVGTFKVNTSIKVTLVDLSRWEGVLTRIGSQEFDLRLKTAVKGYTAWSIPYKDILELKTSRVHISLLPNPGSRPYGDWSNVVRIEQNQEIAVVLENGKEMIGRFGGADERIVTILGHTHDAVMEIPRSLVVGVYGVRQGNEGVLNGMHTGAKIGANISRTGERIGANIDRTGGQAITVGMGAGIGALIGVTRQRDRSLILVFSR